MTLLSREEMEQKILQWASLEDSHIHAKNRGEFTKEVKECLGEEGYKIAVRLFKEGFIKTGNLGIVTLTKKGCHKMAEDIETKETK